MSRTNLVSALPNRHPCRAARAGPTDESEWRCSCAETDAGRGGIPELLEIRGRVDRSDSRATTASRPISMFQSQPMNDSMNFALVCNSCTVFGGHVLEGPAADSPARDRRQALRTSVCGNAGASMTGSSGSAVRKRRNCRCSDSAETAFND